MIDKRDADILRMTDVDPARRGWRRGCCCRTLHGNCWSSDTVGMYVMDKQVRNAGCVFVFVYVCGLFGKLAREVEMEFESVWRRGSTKLKNYCTIPHGSLSSSCGRRENRQ